jgi:hypothetical protein
MPLTAWRQKNRHRIFVFLETSSLIRHWIKSNCSMTAYDDDDIITITIIILQFTKMQALQHKVYYETSTNTQIHGYTDTRIHRYTDTQIHGCTDTRIHRYTDTQIHGYTDTRIHRHTDTQTHRYNRITQTCGTKNQNHRSANTDSAPY